MCIRFFSFILSFIFLFSSFQPAFSDEFADKTYEFWNRKYIKKLKSMVKSGNTVVIAVIGGDFTCSSSVITNPDKRNNFLKDFRNTTLKLVTAPLVNRDFFAYAENFAVVDREAVEQILSELQFQQTGFITKKMRNQLGEMLGVTHILFVSSSRGTQTGKPAGYSYTDSRTTKLVDIKLGKILSLETAYCHKINNRLTKWTKKDLNSTNVRDYVFMETRKAR